MSRKIWLVVLLPLFWALPARADVIYDFIDTAPEVNAVTGVPRAGELPIRLTVTDAVEAAGSYNYSATDCFGGSVFPLRCLVYPVGDPTAVTLRVGLDVWSPLYGTSNVALTFSDNAIVGSFLTLGLSLDFNAGGSCSLLIVPCSSGSANDWTGLAVSDSFIGSWRITGYWQAEAIPEANSLAILLVGMLVLGLVSYPGMRRRI
jgi:hypothetical protein